MKFSSMTKGTAIFLLAIGILVLSGGIGSQVAAQTPPQQRPDPVPPDNLPRPSTTDPRANLKPGAVGQKAAEAAWNMRKVSTTPPCATARFSS